MTVEEMLAREAVRHTAAIYAQAVDRGDFGRVIDTFAADAEFEPFKNAVYRGHLQIRGFLDELRAKFAAQFAATGKPFFLRHHLTTSLIESQPDGSAKAWTRFQAFSPDGLDHTGYYTDQLLQVENRWLFTQRRISIDWYSPASPVPKMMG